MENNHTPSPDSSYDDRLSTPDTETAEPPLFVKSLVSSALNDSFAFPDPRSRKTRDDGWTPERVVGFIEGLAASGVVADACKRVGMSAQSAYAYRNRRSGRAFGLAWDAVLVHRARGRLSDDLISRAMNGCIELVHDRDGVVTGERHRYDNRLSMTVLTRLDRLADRAASKANGTGSSPDDTLLRAISDDLEDYLDCVEAGGDTEAFVEARRPARPELAPPELAAPEPVAPELSAPGPEIENDYDRMASLAGCLGYKASDPAMIDLSDLEELLPEEWSFDQLLRAHYSGYSAWLHIGGDLVGRSKDEDGDDEDEDDGDEENADEGGADGAEDGASDDEDVDRSPGAYMRELRAYRSEVLAAESPDAPPPTIASKANADATVAAETPPQPSTSST